MKKEIEKILIDHSVRIEDIIHSNEFPDIATKILQLVLKPLEDKVKEMEGKKKEFSMFGVAALEFTMKQFNEVIKYYKSE